MATNLESDMKQRIEILASEHNENDAARKLLIRFSEKHPEYVEFTINELAKYEGTEFSMALIGAKECPELTLQLLKPRGDKASEAFIQFSVMNENYDAQLFEILSENGSQSALYAIGEIIKNKMSLKKDPSAGLETLRLIGTEEAIQKILGSAQNLLGDKSPVIETLAKIRTFETAVYIGMIGMSNHEYACLSLSHLMEIKKAFNEIAENKERSDDLNIMVERVLKVAVHPRVLQMNLENLEGDIIRNLRNVFKEAVSVLPDIDEAAINEIFDDAIAMVSAQREYDDALRSASDKYKSLQFSQASL